MTPTVTPTPQITITTDIDCGGPYLNIPCSASKVSVKLAGSALVPQGGKVTWISSCGGASFDDNSVLEPTLTFSAETDKGAPQSCEVSMVVEHEELGVKTCTAVVGVEQCVHDCEGTLNGPAKLDRCGECNGDGNSCLGCKSVEILQSQLALDGNSLNQRNLVYKVTREMGKHSKTRKTRNLIAKINSQAQSYFQKTWGEIYRLPPVVLGCENEEFCSSVSTADYVANYSTNVKRLTDLVVSSVKELRKITGNKGSGKKALMQSKKLAAAANATLTGLPTTTSSCNK